MNGHTQCGDTLVPERRAGTGPCDCRDHVGPRLGLWLSRHMFACLSIAFGIAGGPDTAATLPVREPLHVRTSQFPNLINTWIFYLGGCISRLFTALLSFIQ